jgi:anti-sigma factor RsiW
VGRDTIDYGRDDSETELHAYIDGELDAERRLAFEAFLAANPPVAARVHDYLHQREMLRRGLDLLAAATPERTAGLVERLSGRLRLDRLVHRFGPIAAAILLLVGGWNVGAWVQHHRQAVTAVPAFAGEAAEAHAEAVTAAAAAATLSPEELKTLTGVLARGIGNASLHLPDAGPTLTLVRAAVVPWNDGPALQFVYREADGELLTLFVVVGDPADDPGLHAVEQHGLQLVYWRAGPVAYTVAGSKADGDLLLVAKRMADSVRRS